LVASEKSFLTLILMELLNHDADEVGGE
jgi:hypothetical protein